MTAMNALVDLLKVNDVYKQCMPYLLEIIDEVYLPMEKKQIIDAYYEIGRSHPDNVFCITKNAEEYYQEKFGSNGSGEQRIYGEHTITILEISDEEIFEGIIKRCSIQHDRISAEINAMIEGAKWYREQLNKFGNTESIEK